MVSSVEQETRIMRSDSVSPKDGNKQEGKVEKCENNSKKKKSISNCNNHKWTDLTC